MFLEMGVGVRVEGADSCIELSIAVGKAIQYTQIG